MRLRSNVLAHPAAALSDAVTHFAHRLALEVDCADVGADMAAGLPGFTVVDCRAASAYAAGHVPGAVNLPYRRISAETVARLLPPDGLLVTYCDGPHCNASTHGALRLAELGRQVKEMIGGLDGWRRDGLAVESKPAEKVTA
jgi:rhodanese-related sulfurtransferase